MTGPLGALERSLRDGPPDEIGYRPQPMGLGADPLDDRANLIAPADGALSVRSIRRPTTSSRWPALAAALVMLVGVAVVGIVQRPPAGSGAGATVPPLTETFVSPRNGFSVRHPAGWTVRPATISWPPGTFLPGPSSPSYDSLSRQGEARLLVASQPLRPGETEEQRISSGPAVRGCGGGDPSTWPRLTIDGESGYLTGAACPTAPDNGRISEPDVAFDAIVFSGGRMYQIGLDGDIDLAYFKAVLDTLSLDPAQAID